MAFVAPSNRSTGDIITASIWNADAVANPTAIYSWLSGGIVDNNLTQMAITGGVTHSGVSQTKSLMAISGTINDGGYAGATMRGLSIAPTFVGAYSQSGASGLHINPTFSGAFASKYAILCESAELSSFAGSIAMGTAPASAGAIRLTNNTNISWRNLAGDADKGIYLSQTDRITMTADAAITGALTVGAIAAASGTIRLPNNAAINWRNQANGADISGIWVNTSNDLQIGTGLHANAQSIHNVGDLQMGTAPASAGAIRLTNNTYIEWRNAAGDADVIALGVGSGNSVQLTGSPGFNTVIGAAATDTIGFYGASGGTKQVVSGSRGANAALASVLTALSNLGLITDSSS